MMYSKHAATVRATDTQPPQPPTMADTLTGRASHRLLDQQGIPKPYGALGETLPQRFGGQGGPGAGSNVPANFHRRSLGDANMMAYTEHAQAMNQRRYQYNRPQGQGSVSQGSKFSGISMSRKWASLPKLNHQLKDSQRDERSLHFDNKGEFNRPQSDIVFHEPMSRPNTPVRPASESTGHEALYVSPRIRMQDYRKYIEKTQRGPNILSLNEEEEANAFYEDDFEPEDSGFRT